MPEEAGAASSGRSGGGLLSRTVAFRLKRPAGGCRCIGRGCVLSCAGGANKGILRLCRGRGWTWGGKTATRSGTAGTSAMRFGTGEHVVVVPGGMVAFCPVPFAAETKIPGTAPSEGTVPGISSVFRIFMPDPGLRRSVLPTRRHRSGKTYLLRSGRRLRTVAPACHISLSRISLSSASSFSR